jgi:hypothetical protein
VLSSLRTLKKMIWDTMVLSLPHPAANPMPSRAVARGEYFPRNDGCRHVGPEIAEKVCQAKRRDKRVGIALVILLLSFNQLTRDDMGRLLIDNAKRGLNIIVRSKQ